MSEVNIPLLRKAVEWVEQQDALPKEKREWLQEYYVVVEDLRIFDLHHKVGCGTAYCVAGYIGAMVDERYQEGQWGGGDSTANEHVSTVAERALGLSDIQSSLLFNGSNTAARIRALAEEFAGEAL